MGFARLDMDAEAFLRAFHRARPGITTRAFARGRADDGRSSYAILAGAAGEALARRQVILDLGCGDGHLLELLVQRGAPADRLVGVVKEDGAFACVDGCDGPLPIVVVEACGTDLRVRARLPTAPAPRP